MRLGLPPECIGCANCIDACNEIMSKLSRPTGLVRYDSLQGLQSKKQNLNKQNATPTFPISIQGHPHLTLLSPTTAEVPALKEILHPIIIQIDRAYITATDIPLTIHVQENTTTLHPHFPIDFLSPDLIP